MLQSIDCTANSPLDIKLAALAELYGQYNVHMICNALKVSHVLFITVNSVTNEITLGIQSVVKNLESEFRKSMTRTIKSSVLQKSS